MDSNIYKATTITKMKYMMNASSAFCKAQFLVGTPERIASYISNFVWLWVGILLFYKNLLQIELTRNLGSFQYSQIK